jgi:hypothetical protein
LNLYIGGNATGNVLARFPFQGWTANGAPKYDLASAQVVAHPKGSFASMSIDGTGQCFTLLHGEARRWSKDFVPSLSAYGPDGKLRWDYPSAEDYKPMGSITGEGLMGPVHAGGELGEIFAITQWHGCYVPFLTTDGLFIGRVLRDPAEGGAPGPGMYRGETIQYLNRLDDGRIILSHGKNAHHLLQVTGLDTVKRFQGTLTLTPVQAQLAVDRLHTAQTQREQHDPIRITQRKEAVTVDGKLDEWAWGSAATIGAKSGLPRADIALSTDGKALFLAYKVTKGRPFLNTGQEITQLFLTGDAVDLQFCTDPVADPKRTAPVMGDCRLVISKLGGQPVAVLYQAQVPFAKTPVSFRSPAREVVFDEVRQIKDAQVAIVDTAEGYIVEAAIPQRALLSDFIWPGRIFQGDAGIIVADVTGRRVARLYRFNQDTQVVSDVPTEAALTPRNWGEIAMDR